MHTLLTITLSAVTGNGGRPGLEQTAQLSFVELTAPQAAGRGLQLDYNAMAAALLQMATAGSRAQPTASVWDAAPLTRWLRPALHGSAAVLLLATVSASRGMAADTAATLSWAARLRLPGSGPGVLLAPSWGEQSQHGKGAGVRPWPDAADLYVRPMSPTRPMTGPRTQTEGVDFGRDAAQRGPQGVSGPLEAQLAASQMELRRLEEEVELARREVERERRRAADLQHERDSAVQQVRTRPTPASWLSHLSG